MGRRRTGDKRHNSLLLTCSIIIVAAVFLVSVTTVEHQRDPNGRTNPYVLTFLESGTEIVSPSFGIVPDIILGAVQQFLAACPATPPVSKRLVFPHFFRGPPLNTL